MVHYEETEIGRVLVPDNPTTAKIFRDATTEERYQDGIISMHGYDGEDYWAVCDSYSIQKTENTPTDLLDNYDYIMKMSKEELAKWLTKTTDDAQSDSDTKCNYQWRQWLDEEHK